MAATKAGWFVRICTHETEASAIKIELGLGGKKDSHAHWTQWNSNDPTEFDLPDDKLNVEEIWIKGIAVPKDRNVHMCVCFRDHVAQKMTFDKEEEHEVSQTDSDTCGC